MKFSSQEFKSIIPTECSSILAVAEVAEGAKGKYVLVTTVELEDHMLVGVGECGRRDRNSSVGVPHAQMVQSKTH